MTVEYTSPEMYRLQD